MVELSDIIWENTKIRRDRAKICPNLQSVPAPMSSTAPQMQISGLISHTQSNSVVRPRKIALVHF